MHPNHQLLERFYQSFSRRDYAGMQACYAPAAAFQDPVFELAGPRIGAMWHMLCASGRDLAITFQVLTADERRGRARWEARYTFAATGRRVHNVVESGFAFAAGRIARQQDVFDFWRWSRQALGPAGWLLGWTPAVRTRVQRTARANLERFIAAHPEYQER